LGKISGPSLNAILHSIQLRQKKNVKKGKSEKYSEVGRMGNGDIAHAYAKKNLFGQSLKGE